jgi:hypothetical protein
MYQEKDRKTAREDSKGRQQREPKEDSKESRKTPKEASKRREERSL